MEEIVRLRKANPGGGPHSITGPIYVEGAEPGDTLEIHILKIVPKADAFNFNVPGKDFPTVGQLASEFPEGFVRYYKFDLAKMQTEFKPGIVIDLKPFPGTFAVGVDPNEPDAKAGPPIRDAKGRTSTLRPWKNGSNMDVNELQAGSTLYMPVFQKGGLIWTGDSHCRQGNGEVNLTALECSYKEIENQPIVRKDLKTDWPWAETKTDWMFMGFDEDLNQAMKIAVEQTVNWLTEANHRADEPRGSLRAHLNRRRLPRFAGGRYPQRRALHDSQSHIRQLRQRAQARGLISTARPTVQRNSAPPTARKRAGFITS